MDQQSQAILMSIAAALGGAVVGGGTLIVMLDRVIKSILTSPVLIRNLEVLAASWPAPVRESISDLGKLATEITDDKPFDTPTPPLGTKVIQMDRTTISGGGSSS